MPKAKPTAVKMTPAAIARAVLFLRADGKRAAADYLVSHLPPHADHHSVPPTQQPDPNGDDTGDYDPLPDDQGDGSQQPAQALSPHSAPQPDNPSSEGSLPGKIDKAFDPTSPLDHLTNLPADGSLGRAPSFPVAAVPSPNEKPAHKFGCVYLTLPAEARDRILSLGRMIPDHDLADDGREETVHATALFGLHHSDPAPVYEVLSHFRPVRMRLTNVSVFPGAAYDVVKADVESDSLRRMNAALRSLPHTQTHPNYIPHVTIAYTKPGLGAVYAARFGSLDIPLIATTAVFSDADGTKNVIPLGRTVTVEKSAMSYLSSGAGGALVGPSGPGKRIKLKRNRAALARVCKDALAELGGDYGPISLGEETPAEPFDSVAFVFGAKAFDPSEPRDAAGKWSAVGSPVPAMSSLADSPEADRDHLAKLVKAAPDPDSREALDAALYNLRSPDRDMDPDERRRDTIDRLAAAWRDEADAGRERSAAHVLSVLAGFGAAPVGPEPGSAVPFDGLTHAGPGDRPVNAFTGDSVTLVRKPIVWDAPSGPYVAVRGEVSK